MSSPTQRFLDGLAAFQRGCILAGLDPSHVTIVMHPDDLEQLRLTVSPEDQEHTAGKLRLRGVVLDAAE